MPTPSSVLPFHTTWVKWPGKTHRRRPRSNCQLKLGRKICPTIWPTWNTSNFKCLLEILNIVFWISTKHCKECLSCSKQSLQSHQGRKSMDLSLSTDLFWHLIVAVLITGVACKSRAAPVVILDFTVPAVHSFVSYWITKKTHARVKEDDDNV